MCPYPCRALVTKVKGIANMAAQPAPIIRNEINCTQIALAALPEQVDAVLNHRYRETGKARVFTITESALRELLGSTAPYTPPDLPFYTSEGSVLDVPPLKAP